MSLFQIELYGIGIYPWHLYRRGMVVVTVDAMVVVVVVVAVAVAVMVVGGGAKSSREMATDHDDLLPFISSPHLN